MVSHPQSQGWLKVDWYPCVLQFIVSIIKEWVDHFLVQALIERVLHLCRSGGVRVPGESEG